MRQAPKFNPGILKSLKTTFDETWACLQPTQYARSRTTLTVRVLELAAAGERDPAQLRNSAMAEVAPPAV
jgi:hypothetical protein